MPLHVSCDIGNSADYLAKNDTWLDVYLYFQNFLRSVINEIAEVDMQYTNTVDSPSQPSLTCHLTF